VAATRADGASVGQPPGLDAQLPVAVRGDGWSDCMTLLVMSPLKFVQRPAALVPRLRLPLTQFHGGC
jgi:hypothetical protein